MTRWKGESESILQEILKTATVKDTTLDEVCKQNEKMVKMEITIHNVLGDADTHERQDYLDHLSKIHLWLNRA